LATGVPAGAVMGILMSLGLIQGISDPTNTQNVWVANEVRIDVNEVMWRTLPYAWVAALLGLCIAGALFY
jgi:glycerol uptake facilitator-like aquaporin